MYKQDLQLAGEKLSELGMVQPETVSYNELAGQLTNFISDLINHDFHRLIGLLYTLDVPEDELRMKLKEEQGENAAQSIAILIVERQLKKIQDRKNFTRNNNISEEDRW